MITNILFVVSMVLCVYYFTVVIWDKHAPVPILHIFGLDCANIYVSSFGLGYQIYFWFDHFQFIN